MSNTIELCLLKHNIEYKRYLRITNFDTDKAIRNTVYNFIYRVITIRIDKTIFI